MHLDLLGNPSSGGNCYLLSSDDETIMLDAGLAWSHERSLGVDFTVPHLATDQVGKLSTIAITHPHEDHIGALPYVLEQLPTTPHIVAGPITSAIVRSRLAERRIAATVETLAPYESGSTRDFRYQMIPVPHSSSESMALSIEAEGSKILYSGDLRGSDETGYGRLPTQALQSVAPVDVLLLEAVRADVDEADPTLADLKEGLLLALSRLQGRRIIISAFASNLTRIQLIIELAQATGRHVYLLGRSMRNAVDLAQQFKQMPRTAWTIGPPPKEADNASTIILVAGAQGEPDAGLSRLIRGHYPVQARRGDGLIMSSTPIPGNEKAFWTLVELAMQKGVEVITYRDYLVHLSGHSTASELQRVIRLLRPRWVIPFHGDYYRHAMMRELGHKTGIRADFVTASNGDRIFFENRPRVEHKNWTVDSYQMGKGKQRAALLLDEQILGQRKQLNEAGAIVMRVNARRPDLFFVDCPLDIEAWVSQLSADERRRPELLRQALHGTFDVPPVIIEIG